ncbi:MAG: ABC transporter ATP-binding protein [Anaerolineae bacterium]
MNGGSAPAVRTLNLVKRYGATTALAGLTMTVQRGEIFGFLGPNGAGKTTAVKLLIGLTRPTAGEGWVLGAPLGDRETRRRVGYLPELFRYQDWLSAREVLRLHCRLVGVPRERQAEEITHALETVGLAQRADSRVGTFSKGMQQRLGLGVALLGQPDLIFLDEPTSALDPVGRADVRQIVRSLKERGATVFLNSHLLSEVEQVCDRVAVVDKGRVITEGSIAEVVGGSHAVRLRIPGANADVRATLARYGPLSSEGEWHTIGNLDEARIPSLVADVVRAGGQVYAVEPRHHTLEDRFLQLLEDPSPSPSVDKANAEKSDEVAL